MCPSPAVSSRRLASHLSTAASTEPSSVFPCRRLQSCAAGFISNEPAATTCRVCEAGLCASLLSARLNSTRVHPGACALFLDTCLCALAIAAARAHTTGSWRAVALQTECAAGSSRYRSRRAVVSVRCTRPTPGRARASRLTRACPTSATSEIPAATPRALPCALIGPALSRHTISHVSNATLIPIATLPGSSLPVQKHSCRAVNFHPRTLRAHLRLRPVACRACPVGGSCCSCPRSARATVPRPQPAAAPADRSLESFTTAAPVVVAGAEEVAAALASLASIGRPCSVCLSGTKVRSASAEHVRHEGGIRLSASFVRGWGCGRGLDICVEHEDEPEWTGLHSCAGPNENGCTAAERFELPVCRSRCHCRATSCQP